MGRLFGTDGARGIANTELSPELAFKLGKAGVAVLKKENKRPIVVIGRDTRISGDMLENAITAGILAAGGNVIKVGVIPTPAVALLTRKYGADAGVVISASHNPFEYNGIKFFNGEGYKLADELEERIEDIILRDIEDERRTSGEGIGRCLDGDEDGEKLYIDYLLSTVDFTLEGKKIVLDCANGAAYRIAPEVYRMLGADVTVIGNEPNGININDNIGSTHPDKLCKKVIEIGADMGFAYDGDADRLIVVDEKGKIVDGDRTICICAKLLKERGELAGNRITATVMSNIGLHRFAEKIGAKVEVTSVGDRYVIESMRKTGCVIGGEQSGHIIFLNHATTGDGILSSLQFLGSVLKSGKKVSDLASEVVLYPQVLVNARVKNENKKIFDDDVEIKDAISKIEEELKGNGRVLIRPSGTEPLVRVMLEGEEEKRLEELAADLANMISSKFGK